MIDLEENGTDLTFSSFKFRSFNVQHDSGYPYFREMNSQTTTNPQKDENLPIT
jgi:hypothetical protein